MDSGSSSDEDAGYESDSKAPNAQVRANLHKSFRPATVYMITSPSGKRYIGETKRRLRQRLQRNRDVKRSHCKALVDAIKKYGWESMIVSVLWEGPASERKAKEAELIAEYNTFHSDDYNCTPGGDANPMDTTAGREAVRASWNKPEVRERHRIGRVSAWNDPIKRANHMAARERRREEIIARLPPDERARKRAQMEKARLAIAKYELKQRTSSRCPPANAGVGETNVKDVNGGQAVLESERSPSEACPGPIKGEKHTMPQVSDTTKKAAGASPGNSTSCDIPSSLESVCTREPTREEVNNGFESDSSLEDFWWCTGNRLPRRRAGGH